MNRKPNPNLLTLNQSLVRSLIRTNQTHHPRKSPLCSHEWVSGDLTLEAGINHHHATFV